MTRTVRAVPEHLRTLTVRLVVHDAAAAIDFYVKAFGAQEHGQRHTTPDGKIVHAEIAIGDSIAFVTDESGDGNGVAPRTVDGRATAIMSIAVPDADAVWNQAVAAGCSVVYPLADQFYGDRAGRLRDPFGQQWMISTHIEYVSHDEIARRMRQQFESNS